MSPIRYLPAITLPCPTPLPSAERICSAVAALCRSWEAIRASRTEKSAVLLTKSLAPSSSASTTSSAPWRAVAMTTGSSTVVGRRQAQRAQHLEAVDVGHDDVEQDEIHALAVEQLERLGSAARGEHAVAPTGESAHRQRAVLFIVVDDEQPTADGVRTCRFRFRPPDRFGMGFLGIDLLEENDTTGCQP